jgi:(p)ppGpp synthase/HD superfamily hydrolase
MMLMDEKITRAVGFAAYKHRGQTRKYTGEPYFEHCQRVAELVKTVTDDTDMFCAAYLHDTLEDTDTTMKELQREFGEWVAKWVYELTDKYTFVPGGLNRAERKAKERERLATISPEAQTIKYADLIDNTRNIVENDPKFAVIYLQEKIALLGVLPRGDKRLRFKCLETCAEGVVNIRLKGFLINVVT